MRICRLAHALRSVLQRAIDLWGVLYSLDRADYRRMHSIWQRILRTFQASENFAAAHGGIGQFVLNEVLTAACRMPLNRRETSRQIMPENATG